MLDNARLRSAQADIPDAGEAGVRGAFTTRLLFRHCVHTRTRFGDPSTRTRTVCRFGYQRRLVRLLAWLTLLPVTGPLPHTVHTRAIRSILLEFDFRNAGNL